MKNRQLLVHADQSNLLCANAEDEDSIFIQSTKASEWDKVRAFFLATTEISDWWILQSDEHDNQLADIQQVHHAQQEQQEQHTVINKSQNAVFSWQINHDLMILTDASECDHEDWAAAVTEADVNNKVRKKILSFTESDDE